MQVVCTCMCACIVECIILYRRKASIGFIDTYVIHNIQDDQIALFISNDTMQIH